MKPNVLLVILDSVRANNTSLYNPSKDTTPFLSQFADEKGTTYWNAKAPSIWTVPSHASIFTGLHTVEHRLTSRDKYLNPQATIWSEVQQKQGYSTAVFSPNLFLTDIPVGLSESFQDVMGRDRKSVPFPTAFGPRDFTSEENKYRNFLYKCLKHEKPVKSILNGIGTQVDQLPSILTPWKSTVMDMHGKRESKRFLEWQKDRSDPWAACINYTDAHIPFNPLPDFDLWGGDDLIDLQQRIDNAVWDFCRGERNWWQREALESLYDGAIRKLDAEIERIITSLERQNKLDETLVVITSDHGEGFGEHSRLRPDIRMAGHDYGIHETLLDIPLVVSYPGQNRPQDVSDVVSLTAFRDAVWDSIELGASTTNLESFSSDEPVIASSFPREKDIQANLAEEQASSYLGTAHCVYEVMDESVCKYAVWGENEAFVEFQQPKQTIESDSDIRERVDKTIEEYEDANVTVSDMCEINKTTQEHLENLGYL